MGTEIETFPKVLICVGFSYVEEYNEEDIFNTKKTQTKKQIINDDRSNELFPIERAVQELSSNNFLKQEYAKVRDWFRQYVIDTSYEIVKTHKAGCMLCHNIHIDNIFHCAILNGDCNIEAGQLYLFSKGLFVRTWYIKEHLKHINKKYIQTPVHIQQDELHILEDQISSLYNEIKSLEQQGTTKNGQQIGACRSQLVELLKLKEQMKTTTIQEGIKTIKLIDIIQKVQQLPQDTNKQ